MVWRVEARFGFVADLLYKALGDINVKNNTFDPILLNIIEVFQIDDIRGFFDCSVDLCSSTNDFQVYLKWNVVSVVKLDLFLFSQLKVALPVKVLEKETACMSFCNPKS